jgi:hypothetical protein
MASRQLRGMEWIALPRPKLSADVDELPLIKRGRGKKNRDYLRVESEKIQKKEEKIQKKEEK